MHGVRVGDENQAVTLFESRHEPVHRADRREDLVPGIPELAKTHSESQGLFDLMIKLQGSDFSAIVGNFQA